VLQLAAAQQPGGLKDFNIKSPNHIEKARLMYRLITNNILNRAINPDIEF